MADLTVGASSASNINTTTETTQTAAEPKPPPAADAAETKPTPPPPEDTAEATSGDDDLSTKDDKSWFGSLGDKAKAASKKAWQLTADAQSKANERAKTQADKPVNKTVALAKKAYDETWKATADVAKKVDAQPRKPQTTDGGEFWTNAGEKAGISPHRMQASRDLYKATGWQRVDSAVFGGGMPIHAIPLEAAEAVGVAGDAETVIATGKAIKQAGDAADVTGEMINANRLSNAPIPAGRFFDKLGKGAAVVSLLGNGGRIVADLADGNGLSEDSIEPAADMAVTGLGMRFGGNVYVAAFSVGYTVGGWIDDKLQISDVGYTIAEKEISQRSNIGFLTDRAREMDLTSRYRTEAGTWSDTDATRARSIVREAREHGILDADGDVDVRSLVSQLPVGTSQSEVQRIAAGISRAAALHQAITDSE